MTDPGSLLDTVRSLILDFQEMELETGVPRRLQIETVPGKATVCIGVRRGGKSTYLYQLIARLLEQGVPSPEHPLSQLLRRPAAPPAARATSA